MTQELYLIVDDDDDIRLELESYLNRYGVKTIGAANADQARRRLKENKISLATIDVIMPGENGLELTKWINANTHVPVILLTSLDEMVDRVAGLEIGADDYISKPFEPRELLARARAVLRRKEKTLSEYSELILANHKRNTLIENSGVNLISERSDLKGWTLDRKRRMLTHPNHDGFTLGHREYILVNVLQDQAGKVMTREELAQLVYQREWNPEDRNLDNILSRLRKKVEIDTSCPTHIITYRNQGIMFSESFITTVIE